MTDEEFTKRFYSENTFLKKIKLAISEHRYTIWTRNPPNFSEEFLKPIFTLPDTSEVVKKTPRKSGGPGFNYVLELRYEYLLRGVQMPIYLKGFFAQKSNGKIVFEFTIQSLKRSDGG